jgi:hypothetical protein
MTTRPAIKPPAADSPAIETDARGKTARRPSPETWKLAHAFGAASSPPARIICSCVTRSASSGDSPARIPD